MTLEIKYKNLKPNSKITQTKIDISKFSDIQLEKVQPVDDFDNRMYIVSASYDGRELDTEELGHLNSLLT